MSAVDQFATSADERDAGDARDKAHTTAISLDDFQAYMPDHRYIFVTSRELWPAASVNSRLPGVNVGAAKPMRPSDWLDQNRAVEQMTWAPGEPLIIQDRLISDGGWIERRGCRCFNLYRPPTYAQASPHKPIDGCSTSSVCTRMRLSIS